MPNVKTIKGLHAHTNKRLTEAEFGRLEKPMLAIYGLGILLALAFIAPIVVAVCGMAINKKPSSEIKAKTSQKRPMTSGSSIYSVYEYESTTDVPRVIDCGWKKC